MITGREGLMEAMIKAFEMEKGTVEFYGDALISAERDEARKAFKRLKLWETEHMRYIGFLYLAIRDERETMSFKDFKEKVEPRAVEGAIPLDRIRVTLVEKVARRGDLGLLEAALEVEDRAYNLYRDLSKRAEDNNTREFMREMMGWEKAHIKYIEQTRRAIEGSPGG